MAFLDYSGLQRFTEKIKSWVSNLINHQSEVLNDAIDLKLDASDVVDNLTTTTTGKALDANEGRILNEAIASKLDKTDVVDNLTTTTTGKALDANEGRILNEAIAAKLNATDVVDNLTTTTTGKALDANEGRILNEAIASKLDASDIVDNLTTTTTGKALDAHQGNVLNAAIALKLNKSDLANNVTTATAGTKALDAYQGKALYDTKAAKTQIIKFTAFAIPAAGNSVTKTATGMTENHYLVAWNFNSNSENNPPTSLQWTTAAGSVTIKNTGSVSPSQTIAPIFISNT